MLPQPNIRLDLSSQNAEQRVKQVFGRSLSRFWHERRYPGPPLRSVLGPSSSYLGDPSQSPETQLQTHFRVPQEAVKKTGRV